MNELTKANNTITLINQISEMTIEEAEDNRLIYAEGMSDVDIYNSIYGSNEKIADHMGDVATVVSIAIGTAIVNEDMNDDTSPKIVKPCVYLNTSEYGVISSVSNGMIRSVKGVVAMIDFNRQAIKVEFLEKKTKRGISHTIRMLEVIEKNE